MKHVLWLTTITNRTEGVSDILSLAETVAARCNYNNYSNEQAVY